MHPRAFRDWPEWFKQQTGSAAAARGARMRAQEKAARDAPSRWKAVNIIQPAPI